MSWLDTKIKAYEREGNLRNNAIPIPDIFSVSDKYFEFDDDTTGVDIDGYLFFPKSVNGDNSFSHREFVRTKIMSGGEFTSRGQYMPREFNFETIIDIEPEDIGKYLNIFSKMENKICRVTSPYMGGMFNAEVNINVVNPETSPHVIECKVTIKEIPDVMARLDGDPIIQYPSINTVSDVSVKQRGKTKKSKKKKRKELYDDYNSSRSNTF